MSIVHLKPDVLLDRYNRAASLYLAEAPVAGDNTKRLAFNTVLRPHWIGDSHLFWYEREFHQGREYRLVDADAASNVVAFDHAKLAAGLSECSDGPVDHTKLPIEQLEMTLSDGVLASLHFVAFGKIWDYTISSGALSESALAAIPDDRRLSPDGKLAVFCRDNNLWLEDRQQGIERALTDDGETDFIYGAHGSAWGIEHGFLEPQAIFSPDSKRIFAVQRDTRQVKTLPVVEHVPLDGSIRPKLHQVKLAMSGDEHIETLRLVVIDLDTGKITPAHYPQIPTTRNGFGFFMANLGWWHQDSCRAYFVDVDRDYKTARVVALNTDTGACEVLFEEHSNTHINLMLNQDDTPDYLPLPESNELIWWSERSGWGHYYLYDLEDGRLKRQLTSGSWVAQRIVRYIPERREILLRTSGRDPQRDPYYYDLARVCLDNADLTTVIESDHHYTSATFNGDMMYGYNNGRICAAPASGDYAVVTRSRVDEPPVSLLLDRNGKTVMEVECADLSRLPDTWRWPEPVKLKAADGVTDIYGVVYCPSFYDPEQSYPVISHTFNQPELAIVPKGSFSNNPTAGRLYFGGACLAELGFIVVQIDGRGSPMRDKGFFDHSYARYDRASDLEDHIAGIKQLAQRYPAMDLNRVGAMPYSGATGAVQGLFRYPEFFKVGVMWAFHDVRTMSASIQSDKYNGVAGPAPEFRDLESDASALEGKLLLILDMLDSVTPPCGAFRLVEALQKANKDFDMLALPCTGHALSHYSMRRAWDYLVRHLLDVEPPRGFYLG